MKTRLIFIMVCMMSLLASCTSKSPQDELRHECEMANKSMPQVLGYSIVADSVTYVDGGDVVYHLTCDESVYPLYDEEVLNQRAQEMKDAVNNSTDPQFIEFVGYCRQANADIVYEYNTLQGNTYRLVVDL